jgi:hypothetical protein
VVFSQLKKIVRRRKKSITEKKIHKKHTEIAISGGREIPILLFLFFLLLFMNVGDGFEGRSTSFMEG